MNFPPPCFNTYNNIDYQQRSQTLQPGRDYLLRKYFFSMRDGGGSGDSGSTGPPPQERHSNYANVLVDQNEPPILSPTNHGYTDHHHHQEQQQHLRHHHHQSSTMRPHQQHFHTRSQSQHHYHTMYQSDLNNYYNLNSNSNQPIKASPIVHPISLDDRPPPPMTHNPVANIDPVTIMQVLCNDLGHNIDSAPSEPCPRNYSIVRTRDGLIKVGFPQVRKLKVDYLEPKTKTLIKAGEIVTVLGLSKHNKSLCPDRPDMFYACYNGYLNFDIDHHLTTSPQIKGPWL